MIELTLRNFLESHFEIPVLLEKQNLEPPFLLIEKTSGGEENQLPFSTFAIQSYHQSLYNAALLNSEVKTIMKIFDTLDEVASVKLNADYNFTDTTTKQYRYQAVYDIKHY